MSPPSAQPILQACAVPFRRRDGQVELCLITSISQGKWGLPKGIIEPNQTEREAALAEAWEEAGLEGRILGEPLGQYTYAKWGTTLVVTGYLMQVDEVLDDWPEAALRRRRWCRDDEVLSILDRAEQRQLVEKALSRLRGGQ